MLGHEYALKIVVLGDPKVGKTTFIRKLTQGDFISDYARTVGVDFGLKIIDNCPTRNDTTKGQLWDVAGKRSDSFGGEIYYRGACAAFICFDITNRDSFEAVAAWKSDLDEKHLFGGSTVPCLLIGTHSGHGEPAVTMDEITTKIETLGFCDYLSIDSQSMSGQTLTEAITPFLKNHVIQVEVNFNNDDIVKVIREALDEAERQRSFSEGAWEITRELISSVQVATSQDAIISSFTVAILALDEGLAHEKRSNGSWCSFLCCGASPARNSSYSDALNEALEQCYNDPNIGLNRLTTAVESGPSESTPLLR